MREKRLDHADYFLTSSGVKINIPHSLVVFNDISNQILIVMASISHDGTIEDVSVFSQNLFNRRKIDMVASQLDDRVGSSLNHQPAIGEKKSPIFRFIIGFPLNIYKFGARQLFIVQIAIGQAGPRRIQLARFSS